MKSIIIVEVFPKDNVQLPIITGIPVEQVQVPNIEVFPEEKLSEPYVETFPADRVEKSNIIYIGDEGKDQTGSNKGGSNKKTYT